MTTKKTNKKPTKKVEYMPLQKKGEVFVRFTLEQLDEARQALKKSGAQEIGIPCVAYRC